MSKRNSRIYLATFLCTGALLLVWNSNNVKAADENNTTSDTPNTTEINMDNNKTETVLSDEVDDNHAEAATVDESNSSKQAEAAIVDNQVDPQLTEETTDDNVEVATTDSPTAETVVEDAQDSASRTKVLAKQAEEVGKTSIVVSPNYDNSLNTETIIDVPYNFNEETKKYDIVDFNSTEFGDYFKSKLDEFDVDRNFTFFDEFGRIITQIDPNELTKNLYLYAISERDEKSQWDGWNKYDEAYNSNPLIIKNGQDAEVSFSFEISNPSIRDNVLLVVPFSPDEVRDNYNKNADDTSYPPKLSETDLPRIEWTLGLYPKSYYESILENITVTGKFNEDNELVADGTEKTLYLLPGHSDSPTLTPFYSFNYYTEDYEKYFNALEVLNKPLHIDVLEHSSQDTADGIHYKLTYKVNDGETQTIDEEITSGETVINVILAKMLGFDENDYFSIGSLVNEDGLKEAKENLSAKYKKIPDTEAVTRLDSYKGHYVVPMFEYENGQRNYDKKVGFVIVSQHAGYENNKVNVKLKYVALDPTYRGKLDSLYIYSAGGSDGSSWGMGKLTLVQENSTPDPDLPNVDPTPDPDSPSVNPVDPPSTKEETPPTPVPNVPESTPDVEEETPSTPVDSTSSDHTKNDTVNAKPKGEKIKDIPGTLKSMQSVNDVEDKRVASTQNKVVNVSDKKDALPETGEKASHNLAIFGLGLTAVSTLLGFAINRKRKH